MVRGGIFMVRLGPRSGSEQRGLRPGIIVSHDAFNAVPTWRSLTVVPLTTSPRWLRPSPTTVLFRQGECGLPKECSALAHQVTTIDRAKLIVPPLGHVTGAKLDEIDAALRAYLDL